VTAIFLLLVLVIVIEKYKIEDKDDKTAMSVSFMAATTLIYLL